jgi:hypothetical protein
MNDTQQTQIPSGYYQLKQGDMILEGDEWLMNGRTWVETNMDGTLVPPNTVYIRKEK